MQRQRLWRNALARPHRIVVVAVAAMVLTTGCGIALVQPRTPRVTNGEERTVLIMGDTLMSTMQERIRIHMRNTGMEGMVYKEAVESSGLLMRNADGETPREVLEGYLTDEEKKPDIVVLAFGGSHPPVGASGSGGYVRGSEKWHKDWNSELGQMVFGSRLNGAAVYVAVAPESLYDKNKPDPYPGDHLQRIRNATRFGGAFWGGTTVDLQEAVGPEDCKVTVGDGAGGFQQLDSCFAFKLYYPEIEELHLVRTEDNIKLTPAGEWRAAHWIVDAMRDEWAAV